MTCILFGGSALSAIICVQCKFCLQGECTVFQPSARGKDVSSITMLYLKIQLSMLLAKAAYTFDSILIKIA